MKKRFLSAVITIAMLLSVITGMSTVVSAAEFDFKAFEDSGKEFDKLGEKFDGFDTDNLPTQGDPKGNTNDNTEIKTDMMIAARNTYTLGLQNNGRVVSSGLSLSGADKVSDWRAITMIAAGFNHSIGLKSDGTVVASGSNSDGQCRVSEWKDISAVATGLDFTIGLKKDGTVVGAGDDMYGQLDFSSWKNITAVAAGGAHSVGLKSDGTVVAVGKDCGTILHTGGWRDIVSISASSNDIMGLDKNGKVYSTFANKYASKAASFTDVVSIAAAELYAAGLKRDGTVITNTDDVDVSSWKNIVAITAGTSHLVGLKRDGTVVATELKDGMAWNSGQINVGGWQLNVPKDKVTTVASTPEKVLINDKDNKDKGITVLPASAKVLVNSKETAFEAYTIEGNNYFKLRDLAFVLNGTDKQFEVTWDGDKKAINLLSKKPYSIAGSEMKKGNEQAKSATVSTAKIYVNGKETPFKAYTINGNNFFKLRDIMQAFNVYVGWDGVKQIIILDTSIPM
ncbi:MAG: hypothetical protein CVU87_10880 [Firmicutes bacterium HGW-Firmicutes-12]|jgi:hypothetical protein|nr:MAG: hypothetical protein CVU87_10880 [Firmicutes bacterium HGW-Firmicutes-12]